MSTSPNQWIISKWTDLLLLFAPVWLIWIVFLSYPTYFNNMSLPLWGWVIFILGIDVSHVWSSLFRTYLDKEEFRAHRKTLILSPIIAFTLSLGLLFWSVDWFWRAMVYLAIFHFIKQQYGFIALYKARVRDRYQWIISDKVLIYILTVYPILFWHFNAQSTFNWFVQNDFFQVHEWVGNAAWIDHFFSIGHFLYWLVLGGWCLAQWRAKKNGQTISRGKVLWMVTTAFNWWLGIVYFNSDLVFSISNVVAHGVPYIVLIYFYGKRKKEIQSGQSWLLIKRVKWIVILLFTILLAAFIEEYFWDMLVYREHDAFFEPIYPYRWNQILHEPTSWVVLALLALPQQVHYIIDGFIWRINAKNKYLKPIFFSKNGS